MRVRTSLRPAFTLYIHAVRARPLRRCALLREIEPWHAAQEMLVVVIRMSCACVHVEAKCFRTDGPLFSTADTSWMRRDTSRACHRCPPAMPIDSVNISLRFPM